MTPYYEQSGVTIYHGDCRDVLPCLPTAQAVVCDPPYGLSFMGKGWDHAVPGIEFWTLINSAITPGAHLLACGGSRTYHRLTCAIEDAGFEIRDSLQWLYGNGFPKSHNLPGGFGTALKPAHEPIVLARKLISGTVEQTFQKHGTAVLNIDACRIEAADSIPVFHSTGGRKFEQHDSQPNRKNEQVGTHDLGRWPANVLLDDCAAALLDEQAPRTGAAGAKDNRGARHGFKDGRTSLRDDNWGEPIDERSGASRFYYTSKACPSERGAFNDHPTVKPLALMRYLVRLITPPHGTVLDPFMGSGSTLIAAKHESRKAIGIELEERYCEIAAKRLAQLKPDLFSEATA